jgi:sodium transport system ATP-binding protein
MIVVENLAKTFVLPADKKKKNKQVLDPRQQGNVFNALENVSFSCDTGQVLGLLGPNGAGKTTTLRILSAALKPDRGAIIINDVDVLHSPLKGKQKIGFLSGKTSLYGKLTARENIEYFARLHGLSKSQTKESGERIYTSLAIEKYLDRRVDELSTGMQQKVSIARAVIHNPEVLVLDEPTTGLDIMATETIMEFIQSMKTRGIPVIFSTHHLDEVALLADKIAVIDHGRSTFEGSLADFKQVGESDDLRKAFMHIIGHDLNPYDYDEEEN